MSSDAPSTATSPEDIPGLVDAVFVALEGNGRPRPHALEVGWDTMLRRAPASWAHKPDVPGPKQPDLALIDEAAGALTRAQRPVILAGGGALGGAAPLVALAERLGAPVVMTTEGKGAIPASHPLALPLLAVPTLFDDADVLLILGSRAICRGDRSRCRPPSP